MEVFMMWPLDLSHLAYMVWGKNWTHINLPILQSHYFWHILCLLIVDMKCEYGWLFHAKKEWKYQRLFFSYLKKKKDTARLVYVYFCLALYNYGKNNIRTTKYFSFYCHCRTLNRLGFLRHYFTTPFNRPHTDAFVHKNPSCGRQGNYFSSIESLMSM